MIHRQSGQGWCVFTDPDTCSLKNAACRTKRNASESERLRYPYASLARHLQDRREQSFLLAKGRPPMQPTPSSDVTDLFWLNWKRREASSTWNHQLEKVPQCQWHRPTESPRHTQRAMLGTLKPCTS
jgi:hypothetical protein